jgi:hypothetical protein
LRQGAALFARRAFAVLAVYFPIAVVVYPVIADLRRRLRGGAPDPHTVFTSLDTFTTGRRAGPLLSAGAFLRKDLAGEPEDKSKGEQGY